MGRETAWAQLHPNVLGPDNAYLYLGPESTTGFVIYGNNPSNLPMHYFLRPGKQPNSMCVCLVHIPHPALTRRSSRYFRCQNGRDYKWKVSSHKMEVRPPFLAAAYRIADPRSATTAARSSRRGR